MATTAERLALVRAAIDEILQTGQSVSADGRSLTMANIAELRTMEKDLETKLAAQAGKSRTRYVRPVV